MTTKNDKEMSIKVDLRDKYDRKALTFINGFHRYGLISIKKSFVDRRRKYSIRKYKFDRKTKRWVDNGVAYTKGRVDSRGYVTPNII